MFKKIIFFSFLALIIILLASCNFEGKPAPEPTNTFTKPPLEKTTMQQSPSPSPSPSPTAKADIDMSYVYTLDSTSQRGTPTSHFHQGIIERHGGIFRKNTGKRIYLTYNLDMEWGYTHKLLDKLEELDIKVTFFLSGSFFRREDNKETINRMISDGHVLGSHGATHVDNTNLEEWPTDWVLEDLKKIQPGVDRVLKDYTIKYYRPPYGYTNERNLYMANYLDLTSVFWSFTYRDWEKNFDDPDYIYREYMDNVHEGMIAQLHISNNNNIDILDRFAHDVREMGYDFYTLDD